MAVIVLIASIVGLRIGVALFDRDHLLAKASRQERAILRALDHRQPDHPRPIVDDALEVAKQIELLDKSQEYRCCPVAEAEDN